jgi:hypothetical protein
VNQSEIAKLLAETRLDSPQKLAEELVSVQPMPSDSISALYAVSKSKEELEAEGYKPVSKIGLMWVKR